MSQFIKEKTKCGWADVVKAYNAVYKTEMAIETPQETTNYSPSPPPPEDNSDVEEVQALITELEAMLTK